MSLNHFSSDLPEGHWWSHYTMDSPPAKTSSPQNNKPFLSPRTNSTTTFWLTPHNLYHSSTATPMFCNQNAAAVSFDLNNEDGEELIDERVTDTPRESEKQEQEIPKLRLFEKPLTPSDVGKLNRLVIPKQHAEKYFPFNGGGGSGENGLLLGFEDEVGKSWRFRYSYWNSSQSYVLTKGWSRFVKEKRLDAGDIVIFARHRVDTGRLFIGWRPRNSGDSCGIQPAAAVANCGGDGGWSSTGHPYQIQPQGPSNSLSYRPEGLHAGASLQNHATPGSGNNSKRLRLFGVNLECQAADESEPLTPNHMDINFSGADVYHRQG